MTPKRNVFLLSLPGFGRALSDRPHRLEAGRIFMTIEFDVQVDLNENDQRRLRRDIASFFGHYPKYLCDNPAKVTISRPTHDPYDDRIVVEIRGESGNPLGNITADANGSGTLLFTPPDRWAE